MGGPYCSSLDAPEGLPPEICGVVGLMDLSVAERFSTGAAATDRAKARMAPWMVDFMLIDVMLVMGRKFCCVNRDIVMKVYDPINGVLCISKRANGKSTKEAARRIKDRSEKGKKACTLLMSNKRRIIRKEGSLGNLYMTPVGFYVISV
jgi:hypothetical protein